MADPAPRHAAEAALATQLEKSRRLHDRRAYDPLVDRALDHVSEWQRRRLGQTYADLANQPRYTQALAFFGSDLYGGGNIAKRDADVERVIPIMVTMLPERVITTVAQAMELNVVSHELDELLIECLPHAHAAFSVDEYCEAYRSAGRIDVRRHQIHLIGEIGRALDAYVKKPMIRASLALMRKPAQLAGYGMLQDFLQRGFDAFRRMDGAQSFLDTIQARETAILEAIVAGSNQPFADPWPTRAGASMPDRG